MNSLSKVRDVSLRYGVSNRTLVYYEDMGLIASTRGEDYAYRMYDEENIKRLKQILILRKLNISIKDIQRVFAAPGSDVVLEVLDQKVDNIDDEIALLHELKGIVLEFIRQIQDADFSKDSDVKLLYEKARDVESQLANVDYSGNPANVNRLFEVAEQLEEKAIARMSIPENVMKRLLQNVYFIMGTARILPMNWAAGTACTCITPALTGVSTRRTPTRNSSRACSAPRWILPIILCKTRKRPCGGSAPLYGITRRWCSWT